MVRDLAALRRTPARSSASGAGNDENAPGDASGDAAAVVGPGAATAPDAASRPPLLAIQPPASGLKRKPESPAPTPSKLPFRTPEKAAARSRFGWAPPGGGGGGDDPPARAAAGATPYSAMTTPRAHRGKAAAVPAASEGGSTQSTPTKSVTKSAYGIGMSGSRPPMSGGGPRAAGFGLGFSTAGRGAPLSLGPPTVVNSAEVPHFELREDPSFWMENNVQVVIRVRPLNSNEKNLQSYNRCLKQESAQTITWIGQPETRFTFDHVACETVDQEVLFRVSGLPMVENCMAGYNSCVFAYGQTGSGKTYTMLGEISDLEVRPSPDRGMMPRIFEFLFARIRAEEESRRDEKLKYNCKCSFLEIYNEQITDLLDPSSTNLPLREDTRKGVYVENLTEFEVGCVSDIIELLMRGSANRKVAATNMNRESSRSHSVFTCTIQSRWEKDSASNLRFARLNLVDLAGSERQRTSGAEGDRLKEAVNINKSLSTLGLVIMSLVDQAHGKQRHVPYRDSRLTFLLHDSLGGNSKTMIIANVSPSVCSANETLSTLKFAQRARLIQNNAIVNEDASGDVLALQHQIRLLKEELAVLKRQHVTRPLSISADIFGGDTDVGSENVDDKNDNDAYNISLLKDKQLRSLEEALAGALRRESNAENTIKELETEIEQLNELVRQREEDTRCAKMMLKFRDEKIHRMDSLVNNKLPAESYLLEENKTLSQEIELLRARVDKNPEVTRFALENIRLSNQLRRSQHFSSEGERELLLNEISELRNQVSQILEEKKETEQPNVYSAELKDSQQHYLAIASDTENLYMELKRTSQELETCRRDVQVCLEANRKLTREIADLQKELTDVKTSKEEQLQVFENISFSSHQYDSCALAKMEGCSDESFMRIEEILNLQLELDVLRTILVEERTAHAEAAEKSAGLDKELQAANIRILQACRQSEAMKKELDDSKSVIDALESQQIMLIDELDDLKDNNQQTIELLEKRGVEISRLNNELEIRDRKEYLAKEEQTQHLKCFDNEDSPLQTKLKKMQASLEKARSINTRYQRDQAFHCLAEQEMDEIRRQVEFETAEVIMCLEEELMSLKWQLDANNKNDLLANQSIDELQREINELNDKLLEVLKENESFSSVIEDKEKEIELLTNEWNRLAADIGNYLVDGNAALDEVSDQVAFISKSFSQRKWIEAQVQKMCRGISERDELIEGLHNRLKEADSIRYDLDMKLRSLRGAMQAVNEVHQQEKCDQEQEICLLRSRVSEQGDVNNRQLEQIHKMDLLLDNSIEKYVQKEVLEQNYVSLQREMEEKIHHLEAQLDQSKSYLTYLLSQTEDRDLAMEKLKNEEFTVLLKLTSEVLKAKDIICELGAGFNTLHSSLSMSSEETTCQNSDLNLEDRVDHLALESFQLVEKQNVDVLCQLSNEMEFAVLGMQKMQSHMAKLLQEIQNVKEAHFESQRTIKDLSGEVLKLNSEIIEKERCYEARLKELEIEMQEKDASLISWSKEKEALELELSEAKLLGSRKSFEAATLIAKFEEAQATISDADSTVKALVEANEKAKYQAERYHEREALLIAEKDGILSEVTSLKMLLDNKEQSYRFMEKKFESGLVEANELALELEDGMRLLQNLLSEKLEFVSSNVEWMKEKLQQFAELARTWLEENWLEIIGKDCAISVLHICHMGILLERITGLSAENGFLQRGLCESNSLISKLREHNDKAKNELEMCSVLKGKLLLDINHSFSRIAKKEEEATELNSRLDSFEKKILHLQAQEEAMVARSNSMCSELSVLIEEIDATNKSALAAESNEKEELRCQLDEALLLNRMLKDKMLAEMNMFQMNNNIPLIDTKGCDEFELCNWLADYRSDFVMTNMIAKDIESFVMALELKQHKLQLQKYNDMFTGFLEGLKTEAALSKVDQDLENIAICILHEENSEMRVDLENMKQKRKEDIANLLVMEGENTKLENSIASLESSIICFQTNLDAKDKALMKLECSHATICRELELKTETINFLTTREKNFSSDNEILKQEILKILFKEQCMLELMAKIEADKLFASIENRLQLVTDHLHSYIREQMDMVSKLSDELGIIQVSAEELSIQNSLLQSELVREHELAKGLSFDLSLLQESASQQAAELVELRKEIKSLEQALASKSLEVDDVVSDRQQLEARILKSNDKIASLEEELANKFDELNVLSMENGELKSQLQHIGEINYTMELADKSEVIGSLEEELIELRSLNDERNICFQTLQNDFSKLSAEKQFCETQLLILEEKLEMAQALAEESEAIATESRQIAEEQKAYAQGKDEEVKLLERSIEELENTVYVLESKVDTVKEEAELQRIQREKLEVELQKVRQQMLAVPSSRHPIDVHNELLRAQESIRILEKEVSEKKSEITQCKAHISELNIHAEAAAREYKQKLMELETMAQQVKTDNSVAHSCSVRPEKISSKPRGSGSPFKCIGIGFVQQMNSEKDEELSAAKQRIMELEGIAASRQREIFMLNARLATTESMTHDVIRDMLGVKMNRTTWVALADNQKKETNESAVSQAHEIKESNELVKLKMQLGEFIEERQSWLDDINQKQSELGAARITIEKLRQRETFLMAEVELLKAENSNYKTIVLNLEDEVKKLTRQQNLQLRINHHVKTKEENLLLKRQNEELGAKLQQLGGILTRTKEELARYRVSNGKDPYEQIEEEELLRKKLDESEQDRRKLAENLSSLCTSILKVAGVGNPESDTSLLKALECLNQLQCRIASLENEVEALKLKCKLLREEARLSELRSESSLCSGAKDGSTSPGQSRSPSISSFR